MTISIDWPNRIIHVPRNDIPLVQANPTEIRTLDINTFRLAIKNLEASEAGMNYPSVISHNTTVVLSGITYARVIEIINGFTVTFEDGPYAVNLTGANSNVGDKVNVNSVSVRSSNSAGMIVVSGSGGSTGSISEIDIHNALNSYTNKDAYKANITGLATSTNLTNVGNNIITVKDGMIAMQQDVDVIDSKISSITTNVSNLGSSLVDIASDVNTIEIKTLDIDTAIDNLNIPTAIANANAVWGHASALQLLQNVTFIKGIEGGKWELKNNQMIFYGENNTTELARFNLYNKDNALTEEDVYKRVRV